MSDKDQEIPTELLEAPSRAFPPAPVLTAEQLLPFDRLLWENFERLCLRVARLSGSLGRSRLYGTRGQLQSGIDFYVVLPSGRYVTYQCKRIEEVKPADIRGAVDEFLRRKRWAEVSDRFVFCTSHPAVRIELNDAIEEQGERLRKQAKPINFDVWDAEELSLVLKDHESVVRDFFGPHWADAFFGATTKRDRTIEALLAEIRDSTQGRMQFVTHEWAPERLRGLLESLRENDPETFARMNDLLGSPPASELVCAAAKVPPEWLRDADWRVWDLLARIAESQGEWAAASEAWERLAERQSSSFSRSGSLVSAAVAAKMAQDTHRYNELILRAEKTHAQHPRLVLERLSEDTPPAEQLAIVQQLQSDDPDDLAQIAAHRAIAEILTPDVAAARVSTEEVEKQLPGSILAASLSVSVTVQEGRLSILAHRSLDRAALLSAAAEAESARKRLMDQRRWLQSTRLVMLRADIFAMLGERSRASQILKGASQEELQTTEQKLVLACSAAERALDWELARELLKGAEETPTVVRLRLEIGEAIGTPAERRDALAGLERTVSEDGPESAHAAFLRLAATLGSTPTPWNEEAAVYLKQHSFEPAAAQAEAFYRLREAGYEQALRVLLPYGDAPWAVVTRLRIALNSRAPIEAAVDAAEKVLAIGPSHSDRVEAAQGFGRGKDFVRAREVLVNVARDPGAPNSARAEAFELLMHVVGDELCQWDFASELYDEWTLLIPTDNRAPKWAPRIANRRSHTMTSL